MTQAGTPALNRPPNKSEADRLRERIDAAATVTRHALQIGSRMENFTTHERSAARIAALHRIIAILDPGAKQGQEN